MNALAATNISTISPTHLTLIEPRFTLTTNMPRKRKIPRSGGEAIPLQYSKEDFEAPSFTIVKYTEALKNRNRHVAQRDLSEEEVREQYALALLSVYHPDDAEYLRLVNQARALAA